VTRGVLIDVAGLKNVDMLPGATPSGGGFAAGVGQGKGDTAAGDAVMINTDGKAIHHQRQGQGALLEDEPGIVSGRRVV